VRITASTAGYSKGYEVIDDYPAREDIALYVKVDLV